MPVQYRHLLCFSKPFLNSHSHSFIPPLPLKFKMLWTGASKFKPQRCTQTLDSDKTARGKTIHSCAFRLGTFHPFKLSFSSLSAFCRCWKVQSIESSFTVWSNLLDVNIRILLEVTNSGWSDLLPTLSSKPGGGSNGTHKSFWGEPHKISARDSSENLPTKSVSDNLLVVQLSMAHLGRPVLQTCYRVMWITNGAQRGTPNQAFVSDEFIQTRIQDVTQEM